MSRNGSGTYTLPQAAFVSGTVISSAAMNSDLSDIAAALTQSVSADGQTPLTGTIKFFNGTVSAPGVTFAGDSTSGLYLIASGQVGITLSGTQVVSFTGSGTTWAGTQTFSAAVTFSAGVTLNGTSYTFGAGAANALISALGMESDVTVFLDGGGSVISNSTPNQAIWVSIPCNLTINSWTLFADQSGSITVDIKSNLSLGASIVGSGTKPSLSSAQDSLNNTPVGWTSTTLAKGDILGFITSGAATITKLSITLRCTRTAA